MQNPLRRGLSEDRTAAPFAVVIFGASGDLTKRKLLPALYNLSLSRTLPGGFAVVGVARRDKSEEQFRKEMKDGVSAFSRRKPIDEAFNRKSAERERGVSQASAHDRAVLEAAKALEAANAGGDAQQIRVAMSALDAALRGQAQAAAASAASAAPEAPAPIDQAPAAEGAADAAGEADAVNPPAEAPAPRPAARPVVAVRGDDRPGMKKEAPAAPGRPGRPGERRDRDAGRPDNRGARPEMRSGGRFGDRFAAPEERGPRLGDAAFRAQREALEHAQQTLKKLAAQAHGEALTQVLTAWEKRDASLLPSAQELGGRVAPAVRSAWVQAVAAAPAGDAAQTLLRLEIAAEVPTPAEHLSERRMLQLQLLTRRNDPAPAETRGQDAARVLASASDAASVRRLQNVLKALLRK